MPCLATAILLRPPCHLDNDAWRPGSRPTLSWHPSSHIWRMISLWTKPFNIMANPSRYMYKAFTELSYIYPTGKFNNGSRVIAVRTFIYASTWLEEGGGLGYFFYFKITVLLDDLVTISCSETIVVLFNEGILLGCWVIKITVSYKKFDISDDLSPNF